jgi:hypothetical protein
VDERVWVVQPRGACGHKATKLGWVHWRKIKPGGAAGHLGRQPRPAGLPLFKHPGSLLQKVSCSSSSLFVCLSFVLPSVVGFVSRLFSSS